MRKMIRFFILALLCTTTQIAFGQIQSIQYWFDANFSGRQTQNVTANQTIHLSELNAGSLSEGIHQVHIRARDNDSWSVVHSQMFYKLPAETSGLGMAAYEYWVDNDFAGKKTGILSGSSASIDELDVSAYSEGIHILNIRTKDKLGRYSVVHSQLFYKYPNTESGGLKSFEYWVDNDFANKKTATLSGNIATLNDLNTSSLSEGIHIIHIRALDKVGRYSVVNSQMFYKLAESGSGNKIKAYRYWYDYDFETHKSVTLDEPVNPYELKTNWILPVEFNAGETHTFHIQFQDLAEKWSVAAVEEFKITLPVNVESISLNKTTTTILEGGSETLSYIISPTDASNQNVTWTSSNKAVATVENGIVSAIKPGTAIITVTTEDGNKSASCTVTVDKLVIPVGSITLNKSTLSLLIDNSEMLTSTISPANASNQKVTWTSSNENVATVENGIVNAISLGETVITVTSEDGEKTASCTVTVQPIKVESITLNKSTADLFIGESETLIFTINPAKSTNQNVSWSSSNENVATVENGVVTAVNIGDAVITVTTEDGNKTASCTITVLPIKVESVNLNKSTIDLIVGESETLIFAISPTKATNQNVSWSSSNESVATVENGVVTAVSVGKATISVITEDGNKTASCTVNVEPRIIPVISISLNKSIISLLIGNSETLTYTISPTEASNQKVNWSSNNEDVVTVENGVIKAINVGEAIITITTEDGNKTASCAVLVLPVEVESIALNKSEIELFVGESEQLTYSIAPANATNQNVTWHSGNETVIRVDENGLITAIAAGTSTITVMTEDKNLFSQCEVTVTRIVEYNVEYFFNIDPGFGKGVGIASETLEEVSFNASIMDLSDGLHTLYVRAKNSHGWSQTQNRRFMKASLPAEIGLDIENIEYFIDSDPGYGKGISIDLGENSGTYAYNVDLQSLADGFHTLYVRARNVEGNWSPVMNRTFVKMILPSDLASDIKAVEYYIDTDPGAGNATQVLLSADNSEISFNVDLNSLTLGEHTLYLRAFNQSNQWEAIGSHTFTLISPDGIEGFDADNLIVYPNPVSDFLFIKNEHYSIQRVEITDMTGQTIQAQETPENNIITIPVHNYASGTFILKIYTHSENVRTLKIIKK